MHSSVRFGSEGYLIARGLLGRDECRKIVGHEKLNRRHDDGRMWTKDRAALDPFYWHLAKDARLIALLEPLIGPNIICWGVDIVKKGPGQVHPWHSDIESCAADGGFVSVWIGLAHTSQKSSLRLISGSHRFGRTVQEEAHLRKVARRDIADADVLAWAKEKDADAELIVPALHSGDALFFDGRLWHGSRSGQRWFSRTALLIQFASADTSVRMFDRSQLEWPFRYRDDDLPPVIVVSGNSSAENRIAEPPTLATTRVESRIHQIDLDQSKSADPSGWTRFPQFKSATGSIRQMSCHYSILNPGCQPHPPHSHIEEELLVILDGDAEIVLANGPDDSSPVIMPVTVGQFTYYPAWQYHTLRNASARPVVYLMYKWRGSKHLLSLRRMARSLMGGGQPLPTNAFDVRALFDTEHAEPFTTTRVFEGPTDWFGRLHCHLTHLKPGAGYAPHSDQYDVAIVLLSGVIKVEGTLLSERGIAYFERGELHDMRNAGDVPATYLVFEFDRRRRGRKT